MRRHIKQPQPQPPQDEEHIERLLQKKQMEKPSAPEFPPKWTDVNNMKKPRAPLQKPPLRKPPPPLPPKHADDDDDEEDGQIYWSDESTGKTREVPLLRNRNVPSPIPAEPRRTSCFADHDAPKIPPKRNTRLSLSSLSSQESLADDAASYKSNSDTDLPIPNRKSELPPQPPKRGYPSMSKPPPPIPKHPPRAQSRISRSSISSSHDKQRMPPRSYSSYSDSDSGSERESDYMRIVNKQMNQYPDDFDRSKGSRFEEIKSTILDAERDFVAKYVDINKSTSFNKIFENSKTIATKIFGNVKEILRFHTEFKIQMECAKTSTELAQVFINNEDNLRLHIIDQWKLCQSENPEGIIQHHRPVYPSDFPSASQAIISVYKDELNHLKAMEKNRNDRLEHANKIIINVYKQIFYVNIALKKVIDPNMNLMDCGEVLHIGRYLVKNQRRAVIWKKMDIFFMERYILLIKKKKGELYFINSFPSDSVQYKSNEKRQIMNLYTTHEKKILLLIKFTKDKSDDFQIISSTLQHLSGL